MSNDPLREAEEEGRYAGVAIIRDLVMNRDMAHCIQQVRLAASIDSKYNYHLLEAIVTLAASEMERGTSD